ncbi:unnamed protein product [Porites lobata]|uniref:Endonuclease/exonuclease/phosphatase domain-containing protein n=1 Tax=Porites lobata TaxID=104759 RepID=A0ABN8SFR6_9CNID|nr:unnamed protein product [Porites lobata]
MFTWCRKRKADVIFLQETHSKEDSEKQWANEWGGKAFFSHGSPNSCGLDKKGGVMVPRKMVIDDIECLQNELDLVDVWRIKNPQSRSYTWSQKSPPVFCRLDYWLISNNLQDFVNTTDIIPAVKTDHAAIELNLTDSNQNSKGPGFWKMNVSLLEDPNYLEELKQNIPLWKTTGSDNLSDKRCIWDWLKYNIRNHAILFSKKKAKERSAMEKTYNKYTRKQPKNSNRTLPTLT